MADFEKVSGVFGGVEASTENVETGNAGANGVFEMSSERNSVNNLPAKTGFWNKLKAILFYEVKVELTPYQQKVEDELNEFLYQDVTWDKVKNFLFQEVTIK